ncbi:hypothetical protein B5F10_16175 [Anaerotruncus colihominis]|uniref:Uncharacterized protein n=1 Tax=Anaerotruncus colihominis TaxID=169435 RepID=A0A1Y4MV64_9FIRM|nr:hypothetical protein B5F11_16865 [Anaerotruncus colihominis]OUP72049.1 hypothetical protein B5F10_16175 [Anaerotruncus colihominis]RGE64711.1 hypothetical protein DXC40_17690 [Anaerotruncus colihominis]
MRRAEGRCRDLFAPGGRQLPPAGKPRIAGRASGAPGGGRPAHGSRAPPGGGQSAHGLRAPAEAFFQKGWSRGVNRY